MDFAVEREDVDLGQLPWATLAIALCCVGALLLSDTTHPDTSFERYGVLPTSYAPLTTLTHAFFHAHVLHLLASLALLLVVAPPLEEHWGAASIALLFAAGAAAGGGFYAWMTPASTLPMVGASSATAAVIGASAWRFRREGIRFALYGPGPGGLAAWRIALPVWSLIAAWFVAEVLGSLGNVTGATRGVAYWGQMGGLAAGAAVAWAFDALGVEERWFRRVLPREAPGPHPAIEEALTAREQGHFDYAMSTLKKAVTDQPEDAQLVATFWEMASLCGRAVEAAGPLRRLLERELAEGHRERAALHWCELTQRIQDVKAGPRFLLQIVPALLAIGRERDAGRALRMAVTEAGDGALSPGMAMRVAELAKDLHPPTALQAARRVLQTEGLHEAKRRRLQSLIAELEGRKDEAVLDLDADPIDPATDRSVQFEEDPLLAPPPEAASTAPGVEGVGQVRELSADGTLVQSDSDGDLSGNEWVDPSAHQPPEMSPTSQALDPAASLSLDADEDLALQSFDLNDDFDLEDLAPALDETPSTAVELEASRSASGGGSTTAAIDDATPILGPARAVDAIALDMAVQEPRFHDAKILEAVPVGLRADRLDLVRDGGKTGHIEFARVDAIAAAAVRGLSSKPVVILDLLANWTSLDGGLLRVIRLRADRFDARHVVPDAPDPAAAFKALADILIEQTAGAALPSPSAARGQPFRVYDDLPRYEREVLHLDR